jgi:hypothetical protein
VTRRCFRSALLLATLPFHAGCGAGWHRIDPVAPSGLPKRQQVQVWRNRNAVRLHALRLGTDSISGVPYHLPPDCASCRVTIPTASVDSLRAGDPEAGFLKTVGLVLGSLVTLAVIACVNTGSGSLCERD